MSKECRKYFGKKFYKQKDGYWFNLMPIHAHRCVWINHFGFIPDGMDIHHKDGNKDNNEIENLEMLSRSEHLKRHWQEGTFDLDQRRKQLAEARRWLKTPEGRKKQSDIAKLSWEKRKKTSVRCVECGKEKVTFQKWAKFCGANCEKKNRRKRGIDKIEANCKLCYKIFFKDKYSPQKFCSISCGAKNSSKNRSKTAS